MLRCRADSPLSLRNTARQLHCKRNGQLSGSRGSSDGKLAVQINPMSMSRSGYHAENRAANSLMPSRDIETHIKDICNLGPRTSNSAIETAHAAKTNDKR